MYHDQCPKKNMVKGYGWIMYAIYNHEKEMLNN